MKITENEMRGLLTGKCVPGDMKVNEELPAYLVRKFAEQQQKLEQAEGDAQVGLQLSERLARQLGEANEALESEKRLSAMYKKMRGTAVAGHAKDLELLDALRVLVESEIADFCAGIQSPGEPETPEQMQAELLRRIATVFREAK